MLINRLTKWAQKYGGLYMLKVGNSNMAVVTDRRIVKEVIDSKSAIYSHRPHSYVSHELITKGDHLLVMHYGPQWRTFRRLVHQHLMESMVDSTHLPIVNAEAIQLVRDYMLEPGHHMAHPKRYSNSITNSIGLFILFLLSFSLVWYTDPWQSLEFARPIAMATI